VGSGARCGTDRVTIARQPREKPAAAAMLVQRPNAPRVSGAGPARKTFIRPKACKAPHPLQPIVRPAEAPQADVCRCRGNLQSLADAACETPAVAHSARSFRGVW
jgi:hypothetical protein